MPTVSFTSNMQRHVECPSAFVEAGTVASALEAYFRVHPRVRSYVLDEQGLVRKHVVVFVDGEMLRDRGKLDVEVAPRAEIHVMQALSGG